MTLNRLYRIICKRKTDMPVASYTASLFRAGNNRIAQKVGEEATELVVAATAQSKERVIEECADLFYHVLVLLAQNTIPLTDVLKTLEQRNR